MPSLLTYSLRRQDAYDKALQVYLARLAFGHWKPTVGNIPLSQQSGFQQP